MKELTKKEINKIKKRYENKLDKIWAQRIKYRFNNRCYLCGDTKMLNAHHIIPREVKELRWHPLNGIALCPTHHKYSNIISAHKNPFIFYSKYITDNKNEISELINFFNNKVDVKILIKEVQL